MISASNYNLERTFTVRQEKRTFERVEIVTLCTRGVKRRNVRTYVECETVINCCVTLSYVIFSYILIAINSNGIKFQDLRVNKHVQCNYELIMRFCDIAV